MDVTGDEMVWVDARGWGWIVGAVIVAAVAVSACSSLVLRAEAGRQRCIDLTVRRSGPLWIDVGVVECECFVGQCRVLVRTIVGGVG